MAGAVLDRVCALMMSAMRAAIDASIRFRAMTNYATAAMGARRRQCVNGALETIESMRGAVHDYLKRLIVGVAANFAAFTACLGQDITRPFQGNCHDFGIHETRHSRVAPSSRVR